MNRPKITQKRIEVKEIEDRISSLPDCLLVEIISRLPSTQMAIRTGTLSKRWKYLWTSVHTLIFIHYGHRVSTSKFVSWVEKTLTQCRQSKLRKFKISTSYDIEFESQFKNWIRYAISCNVEELDLTFFDFPLDSDLLKEEFFTNSYFTDLTLSCCVFNPKGAISWKRLRNLHIYEGKVDVDVIQKILTGCPLLETLVLDEDYGSWQLGITSNEIKKLVFSSEDEFDLGFQTLANYLIRYAMSSNVRELDLMFNINYMGDAVFMLNGDFFLDSCFNGLRLQGCIFDLNGAINWRMLKSLYISNSDLDEDMIENILSGTPVLETLELEDCYGHKRLDITSKSVKKLVFSRYTDRDSKYGIANAINAPNILSLTISGNLYLLKLLLSTMPSLVEVKLDFEMHKRYDYATKKEKEEIRLTEEEMLKGFIQNFCHVKELKFENYYGKDTDKQVMLEKYRQTMLKEYHKTMLGSIFEEVHQLKEKV